MSNDLPFTNDTINSYQPVPSLQYPTLPSISPTSLTLSYNSQPIVNGVLPDNGALNSANILLGWTFPLLDNLYTLVAVGWQVQVCDGFFTSAQSQSVVPPGNVAFEYIFNFNAQFPPPNIPYVDLISNQTGSVTIPAGALSSGRYTARIRALVFSNLGLGTVDGQYFKYTDFGILNFTVNQAPVATNLRVNGQSNPMYLDPRTGLNLAFTFVDPDGPQYVYGIQIGTNPGVGFAPNVWDSGNITGVAGYGNQDFTYLYNGPQLTLGETYFWRVDVQDGLVDGGFTSGNDSFRISNLPTVASLQINGQDILSETITVAASGSVLTWDYDDIDLEPQYGYSLVLTQNGSEIFNTGNVYSSGMSVALPDLPSGGTVQATLIVMSAHQSGNPVTATFNVAVPPQVLNVLVDGDVNPGNVSTSTPTISWTFLGNDPGSTQAAFRVAVWTDDPANPNAILLWDTQQIESTATAIVYGTVFPGVPLVHGTEYSPSGYYYAQVWVWDSISMSEPSQAFFAVNAPPFSPTINFPGAGSYPGGVMQVSVTPAIYIASESSPPVYIFDADGDAVTYTLEITSRRSSNNGWEYLAGPFDPTGLVYPETFTYNVDFSSIPAGNDYGIRVLANDGFADSDPSLGSTSPLNSAGLGFTIQNHPPNTPIVISPVAGATYSSVLDIQWLEFDPVDVDGDTVFYLIEYTTNAGSPSPAFVSIGYFPAGTARAIVNTTAWTNGTSYQVRITANDDKGGVGASNYSGIFAIDNSPSVMDVETLGGNTYIGTSDGRVLVGTSSVWQVNKEFEDASVLNAFVSGQPLVQAKNGTLSVVTSPGTSYFVRV